MSVLPQDRHYQAYVEWKQLLSVMVGWSPQGGHTIAKQVSFCKAEFPSADFLQVFKLRQRHMSAKSEYDHHVNSVQLWEFATPTPRYIND